MLGYDVTDDVALVKLSGASGLHAATIGDSTKIQQGEAVVALGNALGRGGPPAVSEGTVAATNQSIDVQNDDGTSSSLHGLLELSARLEPGDSGGPLVDSSGQVIGMDAAASAGRRGQTVNDSFAIPINTALGVAKQIESGHGTDTVHVGQRAVMGVEVQGGSADLTVATVDPGSPAAKAGIQAGDTITAVDGTTTSDLATLQQVLDQHQPGDKVTVNWQTTNGDNQSGTLTLTSGPAA